MKIIDKIKAHKLITLMIVLPWVLCGVIAMLGGPLSNDATEQVTQTDNSTVNITIPDTITVSVPYDDYLAVQNEYNNLVNEYTVKVNELNVQKDALSKAQSVGQRLQSEIALTSITINGLRQQLGKTRLELKVMTDNYNEALRQTEACTVRDFDSFDDLRKWRFKHKDFGDNTIANCREMQRVAWTHGYILSVRPEKPDCIAFVGDNTYKVIPAYNVLLELNEDFVCVWSN